MASLCIDRQSLSVIEYLVRDYGRLSSDSGILETIKVSLKPQLVKKRKQYAAYHFSSSYQFQLSVSFPCCSPQRSWSVPPRRKGESVSFARVNETLASRTIVLILLNSSLNDHTIKSYKLSVF